jgi:uncharacterized protein (DUF2141 family)
MRLSFLLSILLIITACWYGTSGCASISSPQGGPKDTIPPSLISSLPRNQTVNYKQGLVRLEFSEAVALKNLQSQLIISPRTSIPYKTRVAKNVVELRFDKPLADSTTYTFNFRDGVVDITEGNPVENLYLAFSTGSFLDSLSISGQVERALTNQPLEGATVALYDTRDTATVFRDKPLYFTKTDKEGKYQIQNLRGGRYILYGFMDKNNNLTLQSKDEAYGFWPDTLRLRQSLDSVNIRTIRANADLPVISGARPTSAGHFDITFNKGMQNYQLSVNGREGVASTFVEENKKVRIYPFTLQDSVAATIIATDSLQQQIRQNLSIRFEPARGKKENLTMSVLPKANTPLIRTVNFELRFNKPIEHMAVDNILLVYDSVHQQSVTEADIQWNERRDRLQLQKTLTPPKVAQTQPSAAADAQTLARSSSAAEQKVELRLKRGAVISIESDTLDNQAISFIIAQENRTGMISGRIKTEEENFILQLVRASNYEIVAQQINARNYVFRYIEPGEYRLRIIVDSNANQQWDLGNIRSLEAPERAVVYPETISIKGNWEIQNPEIEL